MSSAPQTAMPADVPAEHPAPDEPQLWWVQAWWLRLRQVDRPVTGDQVMAAAQLFSGLLFGIMIGDVFGWSAPATALVALGCAALSWLGRGLVTLVVALVLTASALAALFRATMLISSPHWDLRWLEPVAVLLTVGIVLAVRRLDGASWSRFGGAALTIELLSGLGSLSLGWVCVHRTASNLASGILLSSEDNAAWLNVVQNAKGSHGVSAVTVVPAHAYGPVVDVFLAFCRSATRGPWPTVVSASHTADAVLAAHILLISVVPVVAALLVRRTTQYRRPGLTLVAWLAVTAAIEGYSFSLPSYGFLTANMALLMMVMAASLVPVLRLDSARPRPVLSWLAAAVLIYGAGASWLPLLPVAGLALVCWYATVALPAVVHGPWAQVRLSAVLAVPVAVFGLALHAQYADVVGPLGGGASLYGMAGATPSTTNTLTIAAAALVAGVCFAYGPRLTARRRRIASPRAPLGWLAGYVVFIILLNGWQTRLPPQYGSVKLLYLTIGAIVALGLADLFSSPLLGGHRIDVAVMLALVTLFANSVEQGPLYAAAIGHWPVPGPPYKWIAPVNQLVTSPGRILCVGLTPANDLSNDSQQAYICTRWVSSLQGLDDATSTTWRQFQLGRASAAAAVAVAKNATDKPWRILVIGSKKQFDQPKQWWTPLDHLPGLKYVFMY